MTPSGYRRLRERTFETYPAHEARLAIELGDPFDVDYTGGAMN